MCPNPDHNRLGEDLFLHGVEIIPTELSCSMKHSCSYTTWHWSMSSKYHASISSHDLGVPCLHSFGSIVWTCSKERRDWMVLSPLEVVLSEKGWGTCVGWGEATYCHYLYCSFSVDKERNSVSRAVSLVSFTSIKFTGWEGTIQMWSSVPSRTGEFIFSLLLLQSSL